MLGGLGGRAGGEQHVAGGEGGAALAGHGADGGVGNNLQVGGRGHALALEGGGAAVVALPGQHAGAVGGAADGHAGAARLADGVEVVDLGDAHQVRRDGGGHVWFLGGKGKGGGRVGGKGEGAMSARRQREEGEGRCRAVGTGARASAAGRGAGEGGRGQPR